MEGTHMCTWGDHGDPLVELYLLVRSWMRASNKSDGTTGAKLRTRELLASTCCDFVLHLIFTLFLWRHFSVPKSVEFWMMKVKLVGAGALVQEVVGARQTPSEWHEQENWWMKKQNSLLVTSTLIMIIPGLHGEWPLSYHILHFSDIVRRCMAWLGSKVRVRISLQMVQPSYCLWSKRPIRPSFLVDELETSK